MSDTYNESLNESLASRFIFQPSFSIQKSCFPQIQIYQICLNGSGRALSLDHQMHSTQYHIFLKTHCSDLLSVVK